MPTMVMKNRMPRRRWLKESQMPPIRNHSIFINVLRQPEGWPVLRTSLPKGQRESDAILKIWRPKGIPIIVRQRVTPDKT